MLIDLGLSMWKQRSPRIGRLLEGAPLILVMDGQPLYDRMQRERVEADDILQAARCSRGVERMEQIKYAMLESSGGDLHHREAARRHHVKRAARSGKGYMRDGYARSPSGGLHGWIILVCGLPIHSRALSSDTQGAMKMIRTSRTALCATSLLALFALAGCERAQTPETLSKTYEATPADSSAATPMVAQDVAITTKIKDEIERDPQLKAQDIDVKTENGVVKLSGVVNSEEALSKLMTIAQATPDVIRVEEDIAVKQEVSS